MNKCISTYLLNSLLFLQEADVVGNAQVGWGAYVDWGVALTDLLGTKQSLKIQVSW